METRWSHHVGRAGPAVAGVAVLGMLATTVLGAGPPEARAWPGLACPGAPAVATGEVGTWFRLDPRLDGAGSLAGQQLVVGGAATAATDTVALDREAFAAGPFGGTVLIGTDDGTASRVSLLDVGRRCGWSLGSERDVVRRATLDPAGDAVYEVRVDRITRADLGVWRRSLAGGEATRVLEPIAADGRFGRTWSTEFMWQEDGIGLAVQSCGEAACRIRLVDPDGGPVRTIADPSLGELVGWASGRLITRGACRGRPCPAVAIRLADRARTVLDPMADGVAMARAADGRPVLILAAESTDRRVRSMSLDGRRVNALGTLPPGLRLLNSASRDGAAASVAAGWLAVAPPGPGSPLGNLVRQWHLADGRVETLGEAGR